MASISSHNLAINKSNDFNRRIAQSPYSFQSKLTSQINVSTSQALAICVFPLLTLVYRSRLPS